MIRALLLALALPLAACAAPPAPEAPMPVDLQGWALQASVSAGAALFHAPGDGGEDLRIACRRNPAELWVQAPRLQHVPSEERLSLGAGDVVNALVATQGGGGGVEATGPIFSDFIASLPRGGAVAVAYGAQTLTVPAPPRDLAESFAAACRAAAGTV